MEWIFSDTTVVTFLQSAGYLGLFAIVFVETGFLVGIFLPGDSLLFTAGFLASQGYLNISLTMFTTLSAAILGDNFGYFMGRRFGHRVFRKENSIFFDKKHIERARVFYEEHGGKTVLFARFIPVIRSVTPTLAGVGRMPYRIYLSYSIAGAILWAGGLTFLGYYLGRVVPGIDRYIIPIIITIVAVSVLPSAVKIAREKKAVSRSIAALRQLGHRYPNVRRVFGIVLIVYGFIALFTPFSPGSWLVFIGLETLGIRIIFLEKIRAFFQSRRGDGEKK